MGWPLLVCSGCFSLHCHSYRCGLTVFGNRSDLNIVREELAKKLIQEYGVSRETALLDVDEFVTALQKANCLK